MSSVSFPFKVENGKVVTNTNILEEKVKRIISYSVSDLPYDSGMGAGIDDLTFSVGLTSAIIPIVKRKIVEALLKIKEIEKVNIVLEKTEESTLELHVFYKEDKTDELSKYTYKLQ